MLVRVYAEEKLHGMEVRLEYEDPEDYEFQELFKSLLCPHWWREYLMQQNEEVKMPPR